MSALLEMTDMSLKAGDFRLGPLSLSLDSGDYLVLLGPSGCGKTTLLKAVAGHCPIDSGLLRMEGDDLALRPPHKRRLGYVAQAVDLFPHMTVAGNIAFGLAYLKLPRRQKDERLHRIAEMLALSELLERTPGTLSGGESKRVALARSLVVGPRVLLLDEPLGMLDPNSRADMLETLRTIHDELGTAAIHVTHDREEAWALGGKCAVMRDGRIEQVGPVSELFRQPRTRFVAEFLGGANVLPARFEERDGKWSAVLDWARFELAGPVPFPSGYVQIRPEGLALDPHEGAQTIRCAIVSVADRGVYHELRVRAPGGHVLRAHLVGGRCAGLRPGDEVELRLTELPHPIKG